MNGRVLAETMISERIQRAESRPEAWIDLCEKDALVGELQTLLDRREAGEHLPLVGTLFAVKGNIDVAGLPTTAACPSYAYTPERDASVVARLREAGGVVLGTTNLDQFATGLVGTRSPYGAVRHAFSPDYISGGSSSGSAVAVALGAADFALGTDTAGSGRVPAAFHGLYGIKPTKGWVPASGVVPACRTLDVVTVMSKDLKLAQSAAEIMRGQDERDPRSRDAPMPPRNVSESTRIGVPALGQLGQLAPGWQDAFETEIAVWEDEGETVEVNIEPFLAVARLLYEGAFVAERYTAVGSFIEQALAGGTEDLDPTVSTIITKAKKLPAHQLFADFEKLDETIVYAREIFSQVDALLLPVTTQHPTLEEVSANPLTINNNLGRFTNFANLLDLSAVAYPAGEAEGLPFGAQLVAPAFHDDALTHLIERRNA